MITFHKPCPGKISHPYGEQRKGYIHGGIDIINSESPAPIQSICDSRIVVSGWSDSFGNRVWVEPIDEEIKTKYPFIVYAHLDKIYAKHGTVLKGEPIGLMGNTGHSFGRHLHIESRKELAKGSTSVELEEITLIYS